MPKIIENIRETAIKETRNILEKEGYNSLNMRDIAAKCDVAVGTMYNYFESKDFLVGCVVLEDWQSCYKNMSESILSVSDVAEGIRRIYLSMKEFFYTHRYLMSADRRKGQGKYSYENRHAVLIKQMTDLLNGLFSRFEISADPAVMSVIAEMILNLNEKNYEYSQVESVFIKLIGQ